MTPEEWAGATSPDPLIAFICGGSYTASHGGWHHRLHLFVKECRRMPVHQPARSRSPVRTHFDSATVPGPVEIAYRLAMEVAAHAAGPAPSGRALSKWHDRWNTAYYAARATQAGYLREFFPPPGFNLRFTPQWFTTTVVSIAREMVHSGDFSTMPILADALQDAGCNTDAILNHCRDANAIHVRGCWVVDLVLGKA